MNFKRFYINGLIPGLEISRKGKIINLYAIWNSFMFKLYLATTKMKKNYKYLIVTAEDGKTYLLVEGYKDTDRKNVYVSSVLLHKNRYAICEKRKRSDGVITPHYLLEIDFKTEEFSSLKKHYLDLSDKTDFDVDTKNWNSVLVFEASKHTTFTA